MFLKRLSFLLLLWTFALNSKAQETYPLDEATYYTPNQVSEVYLKQAVVYNEKKRRVARKNSAVTLSIPARYRPSGLSKSVASFRYEDVLKLLKKDERATWVNPYNPLIRVQMRQALENRWFSSEIYQYEHPVTRKITYLDHPEGKQREQQWADFEKIYEHQGGLLANIRVLETFDSTKVKPSAKPMKVGKKDKVLTVIWSRVDFERTENAGFHAQERELSRILVEAVLAGRLTPYQSDKLEKELSMEEFKENLAYPTEDY